MEYLSLPLALRDGYLPRTNLENSIINSVGLLLCTRLGALPFSREYGSSVWEREFSDLQMANKSDMRASLRNAIAQFERRLYNVTISVVIPSEASTVGLGLRVKVTGNYKDGDTEKKLEATYRLA